jgi:hypothetical protein
MQNEPVITAAAAVGALMSILAALVALGVIDLSPDQMGAIEKAIVAVVPIALSLIGAWIARKQVTPLSNPRDDQGRKLRPE